MVFANYDAQRLKHEYLGPEHILLSIIKVDRGGAIEVLKHHGFDLNDVQDYIERILPTGPESVDDSRRTPRAKKVIEYAMEEARSLGHDYVGTEHLLLGLLREAESVAAQVLMNLGLELESVRVEAVRLLDGPEDRSDSG